MREQLEKIKSQALADIHAALDNVSLDAVRVRVLGKKGELTALLKQMGKLSPEERPVMGQLANSVRATLEEKLEERKTELAAAALETLHGHSSRVFEGAITDRLRAAMGR